MLGKSRVAPSCLNEGLSALVQNIEVKLGFPSVASHVTDKFCHSIMSFGERFPTKGGSVNKIQYVSLCLPTIVVKVENHKM